MQGSPETPVNRYVACLKIKMSFSQKTILIFH